MPETDDVISELYAMLVEAYHGFEHAALDGARWELDRRTWLLMRRNMARVTGDPHADDDPPPDHWAPAEDDRLMALPIDIREDAALPRLVPGPYAWRTALAGSAGIMVGRERVGGDAGYRGAAEEPGDAVREADRDPLA